MAPLVAQLADRPILDRPVARLTDGLYVNLVVPNFSQPAVNKIFSMTK